MIEAPVSELHALGVGLLEALDVPPGDAAITMDVLLMAEQWGLASHGLLRLPWYLDRIAAGGVDARASLTTVTRRGATAALDGGGGLGQAQVWRGATLASELALKHGVGVVAVGNTSHSGCLGAYVVPAVRTGLVALVLCNGPAVMPVWQGSSARLSTSAIAAGVPTRPGEATIVDLSLSAVARGRIARADRDGETLEEGQAFRADGSPTTDPREAMTGLLAAFGGVKGAVLAVLVESLAGGVVGPALSPDVADMFDPADHARPQGVGHLVVCLDPTALDVDGNHRDRLADLADGIVADGGRVPGGTRLGRLEDLEEAAVSVAIDPLADLIARARRLGSAVPTRLTTLAKRDHT